MFISHQSAVKDQTFIHYEHVQKTQLYAAGLSALQAPAIVNGAQTFTSAVCVL